MITHNIIAQFASSVYKLGDTIPEGKNIGDFKDYQVVSGSVFNEQYNETLDNATIVLSQVFLENRLNKIKAYEYVRIFDKSTYDEDTGTYSFDKIYLVDSFNEVENNIDKRIFGYTIQLMSETKILEKIQCPNLVITHDIENGEISKKTIIQHIKNYMKMFVPVVKYMKTEHFGIINL